MCNLDSFIWFVEGWQNVGVMGIESYV